MKIGGLEECSLIDYPGNITAILFTVGCNFCCPYCHNPELVDETAEILEEEKIFSFLRSRVGLLDAVTITGGEPTMHEDLIPFIRKIKKMGFKVKLDTNGTRPDVIDTLQRLGLVDYFAMDIKAPLIKYSRVVARPVDTKSILESVKLLIAGRVPYEFRTTLVKSLHTPEDIRDIGSLIHGAKTHYLQKFIPSKILNPGFMREETYDDEELAVLRSIMSEYVEVCYVR